MLIYCICTHDCAVFKLHEMVAAFAVTSGEGVGTAIGPYGGLKTPGQTKDILGNGLAEFMKRIS